MKRIIFYLILLVSYASFGQLAPSVAKYNLTKKRLLIQACSMYLFNANQGAIDADSSVVVACKAYKLPVALAYDEGFNDGSYLIGKDLIEKGDINSVKKLLTKTKAEERIKLLLQLGNFYLFKPGTKPEDLQNAKTYIDDAVRTSNQFKNKKWHQQSLLLLGKYNFQANNQPEAKKIFLKLIAECRKQNDKKALAEALDAYGTLLFNLDPEKEKILQEAVSLFASLGMEEKRIENYMKITTIYFWGGKINDAKKRLYQNLADLRKINFKHQQFAETTITFIEIAQHNLETALYYALKSVKRMEAEKDFTFGDIFYMRLGDVYNNIGHYQEALEMYQRSIEIGRSTIDSGTWYKSFFSAVASLSLKGKNQQAIDYINSVTTKYPPKNDFDKMSVAYIRANCYEALKNYTLAEKYFKEMDFYAQKITSPETFREIVHEYTLMALFYANQKQPEKAQFYTDKVTALCKKYGKKYNSEVLQILLFRMDSIKGNYKGALRHFQNYKIISDSTIKNTKRKEIEELKIDYETKNKEQKIKLLNQESNLKEVALRKSKMLNSVSIWSLVLLLITIGLLYNRYRLKQRNHAKLEIKEKEINQKNINLKHLLDEKEWLLKEIHHRVKNNLQTVISLLNSQSAYLDNDMALSAIKNSQHRIHSMSLIHQKLYNSENISTINMPNYIRELAEYLRESFSLGQRIRFEIKVDPIELDVAQAVPLGLILNEAITNSIKYAFPDDRTGMIYITLEAKGEKQYELTISDNGTGFNLNGSDKKANSFGMSLIRGLSDDIEGKLTIENNNGTVLKIEFAQEFPLNPKRKSI
ncbi:tetratricopeptide repeat-containing sensor histidine kinase [Flavobacterium foetidum]|uniref:tetratricopeptide repeat-containing sensor histidine kinase n=1 Tax=Flavobacterium foetidum TaxID=2026681 RepID=UPI00107533A1|nr:histidine kinase dimerization/phosphoacceptor domain -containing protein [Flavobacterium foetidum]KAF2515121.1 sensor histidine kinase [Flavobacterium foetidum]